MNAFFDENLSRRNFINGSAKFFAGVAALGMFPDIAEGRRKNSQETTKVVDRGYNTKNFQKSSEVEVKEELADEEFIPEIVFQREELIAVRETHLNFVQPLERRYHTGGIVVHHVGNINRDIDTQTIHRWHIANGWAGCGYHYVVRKDGTIERGRPFEMVGAHCYHNNAYTVGICVVGNFEIAEPTYAQYRSTEQLISAISKMYGFSPNENTVFGHRDLSDTLCPGKYFYQVLPEVIQNSRNFV